MEKRYYRWRFTDPTSPWGRGKPRELAWEMTEEDAASWLKAQSPGATLERVGEGTVRQNVDGRN